VIEENYFAQIKSIIHVNKPWRHSKIEQFDLLRGMILSYLLYRQWNKAKFSLMFCCCVFYFQLWYTQMLNIISEWLSNRLSVSLHQYQLKTLLPIAQVTTYHFPYFPVMSCVFLYILCRVLCFLSSTVFLSHVFLGSLLCFPILFRVFLSSPLFSYHLPCCPILSHLFRSCILIFLDIFSISMIYVVFSGTSEDVRRLSGLRSCSKAFKRSVVWLAVIEVAIWRGHVERRTNRLCRGLYWL